MPAPLQRYEVLDYLHVGDEDYLSLAKDARDNGLAVPKRPLVEHQAIGNPALYGLIDLNFVKVQVKGFHNVICLRCTHNFSGSLSRALVHIAVQICPHYISHFMHSNANKVRYTIQLHPYDMYVTFDGKFQT